MTDPICDLSMHWFRQPVFDGEKCLCQQTCYSAQTEYHHKSDDDEPKPFNPLTDIITSPWAPLIESVLMDSGSGGSSFGGGQSGGAGASGDW